MPSQWSAGPRYWRMWMAIWRKPQKATAQDWQQHGQHMLNTCLTDTRLPRSRRSRYHTSQCIHLAQILAAACVTGHAWERKYATWPWLEKHTNRVQAEPRNCRGREMCFDNVRFSIMCKSQRRSDARWRPKPRATTRFCTLKPCSSFNPDEITFLFLLLFSGLT